MVREERIRSFKDNTEMGARWKGYCVPSASGRKPELGEDVLELDVKKCRDRSGWPRKGCGGAADLRDHVFKGIWQSSKGDLKDGQDMDGTQVFIGLRMEAVGEADSPP